MNSLKLISPFLLFFLSCSNRMDNRIPEINNLLTELNYEKSFNGNILIAEKGKVLYEKSFGLADIENNEPLNANSIFNIASISKTITAVAILQLEEKELLNLNDDIKNYFPDFPYDNVTIKNLLTHTSGLYRIQSKLIRKQIDQKGLTNNEVLEVYKRVFPKAYFPSGTNYTYANTNYILLALIVEEVSGKPYEIYIDENIFQKAGMNHTFLKEKRIPSELKNEAVTYYRKPKWLSKKMIDVKTIDNDMAEIKTFENNYGESAIYTTARDLLNYHKALQNGTLLNSKSLVKMYTPYKLSNGKEYTIDSNPNYPSHSGLSWGIAKNNSTGQIVYHAGGFRGGRHFFIRNTTTDQCVIMLTNNGLTDVNTFTAPMRILNNQTYKIDKKSLPKLFSSEYVNKGFDAAIKKYRELENDDNYIQFIDWDFEEIGEELMQKNDYESAIELYKIYTSKYPKDEFSWSLLGDAYYANKDANKALENYQKSLRVNPEHEIAKQMIHQIGETKS